jgi:hypothetical protein
MVVSQDDGNDFLEMKLSGSKETECIPAQHIHFLHVRQILSSVQPDGLIAPVMHHRNSEIHFVIKLLSWRSFNSRQVLLTSKYFRVLGSRGTYVHLSLSHGHKRKKGEEINRV